MIYPVTTQTVRLFAAAIALWTTAGTAGAADAPLAPHTKLRVSVVQWMPVKGAYEQWNALGGDFTVSENSTVVLPVIGAVPVGTLDASALATEISRRLQAKIGTVDSPNTTVEIVEYPPIYIVGDVKTPGSYGYRVGMTVLQALALGGGEIRSEAEQSRDQITLVGELQDIENGLLRSNARLARLRAERAGDADISFPPAPAGSAGQALAKEVFAQEKMIFAARANEVERQTKSLTELRQLFNAEIEVLQQKIVAADVGITTSEKALENVTVLVEKGIAVASRQSDLELALANHRANRLDQVTAVMRARQSVAEATRNLDGLHDKRITEIAQDMQQEQSSIEQTLLKREVTQKLLLELLSSSRSTTAESKLAFTILRQEDGHPVEIQAEETTQIRPGDVIKASFLGVEPGPRQSTASASPPLPDGLSQ